MKKNIFIFIALITLFLIFIYTPLPIPQEQKAYNNQISKAIKLKHNGQIQEALNILNDLEKKYPQTANYLELEKYNCYQRLNDYDKVFDTCINSKLTEYLPVKAAICSIQLSHAGRQEEAIAIWNKNIQYRDEKIFPYANINKLMQIKEIIAITIHKSLISLINNPTNEIIPLKKICLANIYYELGDYEKALENAKAGKNHLLTGKIFLKLGDFENAQKEFNQETSVYRQLEAVAYTHLAKKEYNKAKLQFNKMLKINDSNVDTLSRLGEIALIQKNHKQAKLYYKKILKYEPFNATAKAKLKTLK